MFKLFLLTLLALLSVGNAVSAGLCSVAASARKDCGYSGISETECLNNKGCCYSSATLGAPYCFFSGSCVASSDSDKKDCGYSGEHL